MTMDFDSSQRSPPGSDGVAISVAAEASAQARAVRTEVEALAEDLGRLFTLTQALWQILRGEHGWDDDKLRLRVSQIDLAAKTKEGTNAPMPCMACGRPVSHRRSRCMYCGVAHQMELFAR